MKISIGKYLPPKKTLVPFLILFVLLTLFFPKSEKFAYDYKKGQVWKHETLIAQFDFPIYKTDDEIRQEREAGYSRAIPYYRYSEDVVANAIKSAESIDLGNHSRMKPAIVSSMRTIYATGIISDFGVRQDRKSGSIDEVVYVQKDKRAEKYPLSELYRLSDARNRLLSMVGQSYPNVNVDSLLRQTDVYDLLTPNLLFDKQTTDLIHSETYDPVSPTSGYMAAGSLVVSNGELITAEVAQMLDSYKREFEENIGSSQSDFLMWLGSLLLALAMLVILYFTILLTRSKHLRKTNKLSYILFIFLLSTLLTTLSLKGSEMVYFMIPYTLMALYLQAFFKNRFIVAIYSVSLLPLLLFAPNGVALFLMFWTSGIVSIHSFKYFGQGWMQFINALISFAVITIVYFGLTFLDMINTPVSTTVLYLLIGSLLSVAGYPLIYLFEIIFSLLSSTRLAELADTNHKLLRQLEEKAPGTFQHSLQVMNMCEAVARSLEDANVELLRVGALYHDIGKLGNPECFVENQNHDDPNAGSYHDNLPPKQSAEDIIRHVTYGVELAEKYRIPSLVKDYIITHHGTTCVVYFYDKFLKQGGSPDELSSFVYPGKIPHTKEQVILMLCDSIEAAARTIKDRNAKSYSDLVENIAAAKMKEGQFEEADMSLHELKIVKETIKTYLAQIYHDRIVYPKRRFK